MAINLGSGFNIGSKQPIDDRLIMTKSEMLNVNENTFPDVYMCICKDDGAILHLTLTMKQMILLVSSE